MGQKIVVTANVKAHSADSKKLTPVKVSYQWHWRRIILAGGVLIILSFAAIEGAFSVVNANETYEIAPSISLDTSVTEETLVQELTPAVDHAAALNIVEHEGIADQSIEVLESPTEQTQIVEQVAEPSGAIIEVSPEKEALQGQDHIPQLMVAELSPVSRGVYIDTSVVSRAVLTRSVQEREPIDVLPSEVYTDEFEEKLYFFTELNNFTPQQVTHVWQYDGKTMAEIPLDISSNHFRTFSSKNIMNTLTGDWTVQLRDSEQKVLAEKSFRIINKQRNL